MPNKLTIKRLKNGKKPWKNGNSVTLNQSFSLATFNALAALKKDRSFISEQEAVRFLVSEGLVRLRYLNK